MNTAPSMQVSGTFYLDCRKLACGTSISILTRAAITLATVPSSHAICHRLVTAHGWRRIIITPTPRMSLSLIGVCAGSTRPRPMGLPVLRSTYCLIGLPEAR